ncbi:MAG: AsmA family protein [Acetobacteraceae bacterium]|jgi:uncharacterized protein involved in outer membrane biogenesis|nr:AsmA family protein [Acetobacteraceae bacterium]
MFGDRYNFASLVSERLTASLDRKVAIASLHVTPGRWLHAELRDFRLDNLPGGSQPDMMTLPSASADIDALSLLHGPVVLRTLRVSGLRLLLEHTANGAKNWKFGAAGQTAPPRGNGRADVPTLLDAELTGDVVFRTSEGNVLDTNLDQAQIRTEAADQPVRVTASGSYNSNPVKLQADLASLDVLRDAATPYPADMHVTSGDTTLHFQGTLTDPLNADGAKGRLELDAPTAATLLAIAGQSGDFDASLRLAGPFEHDGLLWHLTRASGALNKDTITAADLKLVEGLHGKPDDVTVDLAFARLDVDALLGGKKKGPAAGADVPLSVDRAPDTLIAAKLSARELAYAGLGFTDVTFGGSVKPGLITVDVLSVGYLGAPFRATGKIEAGPRDTGVVTADVDMNRMDVQALRKLLGFGDVPVLGQMDGRVSVEAAGATLNQAARGARMSAVLAMNSGSISRRIIELAAIDARGIFRSKDEMTPISCLIAVLDIRAGTGTISPIRIRSANGTITGRGSFDIYRHQIDITVASDARTTGLLALDVPVRISGSFESPAIRPASLSAAGRAQLLAGDDIGRLLPSLRPFARRSPCLNAGAG